VEIGTDTGSLTMSAGAMAIAEKDQSAPQDLGQPPGAQSVAAHGLPGTTGTEVSRPPLPWCFAQRYQSTHLLTDPVERHRFVADFLGWERKFMQLGVGIAPCGLTLDGVHIDVAETTEAAQPDDDGGCCAAGLHTRIHSNPSKEALHLALLALAVEQEGLPRLLFSFEEALEQLRQKVDTLDAYRCAYPENHGFMPWFESDAQAGCRPLEPDLAMRYNGMLAWALYAVAGALEQAGEHQLASRFDEHLAEMRRWAVGMAYKGRGLIAARVTAPPRGGEPVRSGKNCNDPFAGELFCLFLDLLGEWGKGDWPQDERDNIWSDPDRHGWLRTAVLELPLSRGDSSKEKDGSAQPAGCILVEAMLHSTFSAHEEWKYLLMPYTAVPVARRLLHSTERARAAFANAYDLPGLLGDCHVPTDYGADSGTFATQHITVFGIPELSISLSPEVARRDVVAASGSFGMLLAEPAVGAAWLRETLAACPAMQTCWGMAESCRADGAWACPLLTWDAKGPVVLAALGGLGSLVQRRLVCDGLFGRFKTVVSELYSDLLGLSFHGDCLDLPPPRGAAVGAAGTSWRSRSVSGAAVDGLDLQLVQACRGVALPPTDAWKLGEVRAWFEEHQSGDPEAPYCLPALFEDWCSTMQGAPRYAADGVDRERLYEHIVAMFELGVPLVLLGRQAPKYSLFFDVDVYGGEEGSEGADSIHRIVWDNKEKVLVRAIAAAVMQVYPHLNQGLELAAYGSSGWCQAKHRYKASYHLVFPHVIVDRPIKPWPDGPQELVEGAPGRHLVVRDHVVCRLTREAGEPGPLADLHEQLLECCSLAVLSSDDDDGHGDDAKGSMERAGDFEDDEDTEPSTFLNDWTEILDDKPLRHEPQPEALTGFRLPFTDKAVDGIPEGRPKVPLGRWCLRGVAAAMVETVAKDAEEAVLTPLRQDASGVSITRLPDLQPVEWVRLGDISACPNLEITAWDIGGIDQAVQDELDIPLASL